VWVILSFDATAFPPIPPAPSSSVGHDWYFIGALKPWYFVQESTYAFPIEDHKDSDMTGSREAKPVADILNKDRKYLVLTKGRGNGAWRSQDICRTLIVARAVSVPAEAKL
jgi:hypothetical protein